MKKPTLPLATTLSTATQRLAAVFLLTAFGATSLVADVVYVTARPQPLGAGPNTDGSYYESTSDGGIGIVNGDTSAKSAAATPVAPTSGSRYYSSSAPITDLTRGFALNPTLATPGGVYQIDHAFSSTAGNANSNAVLSVACTNGTLSVANTDKFQKQFGTPNNQWALIGYLTNSPGSSTPWIDFRYESGYISAAAPGWRLLLDTFRFTLVTPCLAVAAPSVTGPLATNLATVVVTNILNTATLVKIYQDAGSGMTNIGSLAVSSPGTRTNVPVTGTLVKGAKVSATQVVGGQESCVQTTGAIVGGGANPSVRIALTVRENTALTGPVGAAGSGTVVSFLGASSVLSGGAPEQGIVLQSSTEWQTVSFTNGVDPLITWAGVAASPGFWTGPFGALDGLAIACEGDSGPFQIYFDDFANGIHGVFQDFESQPANAIAYAFSQPSFSGSSFGVIAAPNDSRVVNTAAASGTKSMRLQFQFGSQEVRNWLRFVTSGNSGAPANPQLDVNEPVSFKVLLLPPNAVPTPPTAPTLTANLIGGQTVLNWIGGHRLQAASDVTGVYTNIPSVTLGPWTNNLPDTQKFFRLVD
jgi:hypothetical protein